MGSNLVDRPSHLSTLSQCWLWAVGIACLIGLPIAANPFGLRAYPYGKAGWLLICSVLLAGALLLWHNERQVRPSSAAQIASRDPLCLGFLVWLAWLGINAMLAMDRVPAWLGDSLRREGAFLCIATAVVTAAVYFSANGLSRRVSWPVVLCIGTVIPALATFFQFWENGWTLKATLTGTQGNSGFLGALMMLGLPITAALWWTTPSGVQRRLWMLVGGLQLFGLAVSLARGPLLGALVALWALALWGSIVARQRSLQFVAALLPVLAGAALFVLNILMPSLSEQVPALARFQFSGSASTEARLGIWAAGMQLFAESGAFRQLVGYGADAGATVFMSHIPAWVFRTEGPWFSIDRMHSQTLETLLTFGMVGVVIEWGLFAAVMHRWIVLSGLQFRGFTSMAWASGVAGIAAVAGGMAFGKPAVPSLLGVGFGLGWLAVWLVGHWQASRRAMQPGSAPLGEERFVLAALGVSLAGYWIASQVGVNDVAVKMYAYALAAMIAAQKLVAVTTTASARAEAGDPPIARTAFPAHWVLWTVIPLACLTLAPAFSGATSLMAPTMPMLAKALICAAACSALALANRCYPRDVLASSATSKTWKPLLWMVPSILIYGAAYYIAMASLAGSTVDTLGVGDVLASTYWLATGLALVGALAGGLIFFGNEPHAPLTQFSHRPGRAIAISVVLVLSLAGTLGFVVGDSRADISAKLAQWSTNQGRPDRALLFSREATQLAGTQRTAWVGLAQAEFGQAVAAAGSGVPAESSSLNALKEALARSIQAAEQGRGLSPADPSLLGLLAEANSFKAAPQAMAAFGGEAARKSHGQEAIRYFEESLKTRGMHPWTLRSLVRLELDYGTRERALRFAERLIASDPKGEIGYEEKALIALKANDMAQFAAVLREGIAKTGGALSLRRPLAEWLFRQGDVAGATRELEAVVAKTPKDWTAVRDLIRLYLRQNANDKALALAQGARSFVPEQERASLEELLRNLQPQPFTGGGLKP